MAAGWVWLLPIVRAPFRLFANLPLNRLLAIATPNRSGRVAGRCPAARTTRTGFGFPVRRLSASRCDGPVAASSLGSQPGWTRTC